METKKIIIAVDGHSSTGKSTFAKIIAKQLGYIYVDTGAMYRAVTLYCMQHGLIDEKGNVNKQAIIDSLADINIEFKFNAKRGASDTYLNGTNVEDKIRTIEVSQLVSTVSTIPEVRTKMVEQQQQMGKNKGLVMDGRDIGTVVFPDAELKLFMTADARIRAIRRYDELKAKGEDVSLEEIERNVIERDYTDSHRETSPLRKADDAVVLDNSHMTPDEQLVWFNKLIKAYI